MLRCTVRPLAGQQEGPTPTVNALGLSFLPAVPLTGAGPQAPHAPGQGARRVPAAPVVRLDAYRTCPDDVRPDSPRAERERADHARFDRATRPTVSLGLGYDHVTFAALDRPGLSLAFAAQAYFQESAPGSLVPPAFAAQAYQANAAARFGFMGLLEPLDLSA